MRHRLWPQSENTTKSWTFFLAAILLGEVCVFVLPTVRRSLVRTAPETDVFVFAAGDSQKWKRLSSETVVEKPYELLKTKTKFEFGGESQLFRHHRRQLCHISWLVEVSLFRSKKGFVRSAFQLPRDEIWMEFLMSIEFASFLPYKQDIKNDHATIGNVRSSGSRQYMDEKDKNDFSECLVRPELWKLIAALLDYHARTLELMNFKSEDVNHGVVRCTLRNDFHADPDFMDYNSMPICMLLCRIQALLSAPYFWIESFPGCEWTFINRLWNEKSRGKICSRLKP